MLCYEAMAGRQERLLSPVEQEDQVVGEGGLLAAQHHPSHLEHDGTAGAIVASTWTLDCCQVILLTACVTNLGHAVKVAVEKKSRPRARWSWLW